MDINAWTAVGVIVAALALIATVFFGVRTLARTFPKRSPRYEVEATPLLRGGAAPHQELRVVLGARPLEDPYLVTVSVRSNSRADIPSSSFDAGRAITFSSSTPMYVSRGSEAGLKSIGMSWSDYGDGAGARQVSIAPQLIRPKAIGSFNAVTEGRPLIDVNPSLINVDVKANTPALSPRTYGWVSTTFIFISLALTGYLLSTFLR